MCKNKGKHCTNVVDVITLVLLSPRTSDVTTANAMTLVKVLHQLLTFADAISPMKGLHKLVTFEDAMTPMKGLHELVILAFFSVTYFCFENKLLWKLTSSPSPFSPSKDIFIIFMTTVKGILFGWPPTHTHYCNESCLWPIRS